VAGVQPSPGGAWYGNTGTPFTLLQPGPAVTASVAALAPPAVRPGAPALEGRDAAAGDEDGDEAGPGPIAVCPWLSWLGAPAGALAGALFLLPAAPRAVLPGGVGGAGPGPGPRGRG